jgi:hypothetical protein
VPAPIDEGGRRRATDITGTMGHLTRRGALVDDDVSTESVENDALDGQHQALDGVRLRKDR